MNFNKKVKGFFISSLTALIAVCGVAFGVTYKNAAVKADDAVSNDIQAIIANFTNNRYSAEYVEDAAVGETGQTVSGVRVSINVNADSNQNSAIGEYFDVNGLKYTDSLFGIVFDQKFGGSTFSPGIVNQQGQIKFFVFNTSGSDSTATPKGYMTVRTYDASASTAWEPAKNPYSAAHGFGADPNATAFTMAAYSLNAYTATPFNVYYDNNLNMLLDDKISADESKVVQLQNVQGTGYSAYKDPYTGADLIDSTVDSVSLIDGYAYNQAKFALRTWFDDREEKGQTVDNGGNTFILTSFAGLDLTQKGAAYDETTGSLQLADYNSQLITNTVILDGSGYVIPEAQIASRLTHAKVADFAGTVNVYNGRRSSVSAEYGSYGYEHATIADDLGAPIATDLSAGAEYTFPAAGDYTLEYVHGDKKLYVDISAVQMSDDVKAVINAINGASNEFNYNGGAISAEYVNDYSYNGSKISGVKVTVSGSTSALYLPMLVKVSDLTYNDNTLGYFMTPAVQGTNDLSSFNAYIVSADKQKAIVIEHGIDSDNEDTASAPRAKTNIKVLSDGLSDNGKYFGLYNPDNTAYPFGTRGLRGVSLNGYAKVPFNFAYDASLNAVFGDINSSTGHSTGNKTRFMRALGVSPSDYASYTDPTTGSSLKVNGSSGFEAFGGVGEYAYVGFRPILKSGVEEASFILTSYAGLDLTDPTSVGDNILTALNGESFYKESIDSEVTLPEIKTVSRISGSATAGDFDGTVTIYKGAREDKYVKYGSWGAESLAFPTYGGEAVNGLTYLGVAENGVYTFTESGYYTLVYKSADETQTEIKEIYISAKTFTLKLNAFNATLQDENGSEIVDGGEVYSGQKIIVVPNDGYTILDAGKAVGGSPAILIGEGTSYNSAFGTYRTLTNGAYVIQESDESSVLAGVLDVGIAAYKQKYTVKFYKNAAENSDLSASILRTFDVYSGVPASYKVDDRVYCLYNSAVFKPTSGEARWYNNFGFDGERLLLTTQYNWISEYNATENDVYNSPQILGYYLTYADGSAQKSALYKIGGNYKPIIDSDVTVEAAFIRSFVDYTNAKIETSGTIGLSVKLGISKPDYLRLARMLGTEAAFDMNAVITTGTVLDGLAAQRKNAFHVTRDNPDGCVQTAINRGAVATETYNGKEYYVYTVKGVNIPKENYAKDYVFGGYLSYTCPNGGQVIRFGQGGAEFEKINVYKAACTTFGEGGGNVTTEAIYDNYCEINGLKYYSDTLDERGIYFAVKYYYVGMYLTYVTETETEGYAKYELNGKTYYYDSLNVGGDDIIRAIKFYHGVSLAEEV